MRMFFIYGLEQQLIIGAGASITKSLSIDNDADFIARYLQMSSTGSFLLMITDNTTGLQWFSRDIHSSAFVQFGTGANVYRIPIDRFCKRSSTLSFRITNVHFDENRINISLAGYKQSRVDDIPKITRK